MEETNVSELLGKLKDLINSFDEELREKQVEIESGAINLDFTNERAREERYNNLKMVIEETKEKAAKLESNSREMIRSSLGNNQQLFEVYQKESSAILERKDKFIKNLIRKLKIEEEYYTKDINVWKKAIDDMVKKSRVNYRKICEEVAVSLKTTEERISERRKELMSKFNSEIDGLFKKQGELESSLCVEREDEERKNFKEITNLRQSKNKEYIALKLSLENIVQNHEKCLEEMRAVYQLNGEKLNYNFKVLSEKHLENTSLIAMLKKKERAFLNTLKNKNDEFATKDSEFRKKNIKLTEQSKIVSQQYQELHKKFKHFEQADLQLYEEIEEMLNNKLKKCKDKVLSINKVIMNQHLGLSSDANEEANASEILDDNLFSQKDLLPPSSGSFSRIQDGSRKSLSSRYPGNDSVKEVAVTLKNNDKLELLDMLLTETEFLFDDKLLFEIQNISSEEEKLLAKLNLLRKLFKIPSSREFLNFLSHLFLNCVNADETVPRRARIILALNKLLEMKETSSPKDVQEPSTLAVKQNKKESRKLNKKIWSNYHSILNEETQQIWRDVEKFTLKHYKSLQKRKQLLDYNKKLEKQNQQILSLINSSQESKAPSGFLVS